MRATTYLSIVLALVMLNAACASAEPKRPDASPSTSSVGMAGRIEQIVLPGSELTAKPIDSREVPLVLRVVATYPHGTSFRYDLEYYGLEPGVYDLGDYLQRKDGTPVEGLPKLPVEITSLLPSGQILPAPLESQDSPRLGGYRSWLILGMIAWLIGLAAILFARRRAQLAARPVVSRPLSVAERLRPLVAAATAGKLSAEETAEIERLLLSYWRHRLNLDEADPLAAVETLRGHQEAGALLREVEAWLHKPGGAGEVDVAALLAPYRDLPLEATSLRQDELDASPIPAGERP